MITGENLIIISFENGGGGHRLGRILCSLPDVYWYSHPDNGTHPWNVHFEHTNIRQRYVSRFHFDRLVPNGMLPPTHDYVSKFITDEDTYYNKYFYPKFLDMGGVDILNEYKLLLVSHALPNILHKRFPDAKIINLIGDSNAIAERYLKTTALFPAYLKLKWLDGENTEYGKKLKHIAETIGNKFTVRDIWAFEKYNTEFHSTHENEYKDYVYNLVDSNMEKRISHSNSNCINVDKKEYKKIKDFING
jgi:hypothetical protein